MKNWGYKIVGVKKCEKVGVKNCGSENCRSEKV